VSPSDITLNFGGIHSETARCSALVSEFELRQSFQATTSRNVEWMCGFAKTGCGSWGKTSCSALQFQCTGRYSTDWLDDCPFQTMPLCGWSAAKGREGSNQWLCDGINAHASEYESNEFSDDIRSFGCFCICWFVSSVIGILGRDKFVGIWIKLQIMKV
jgi:hypothetical protein